jgi:hypothetical protein
VHDERLILPKQPLHRIETDGTCGLLEACAL